MNDELPPEPSSGVASALGTLRHALADPLSAAGLKLALLERRLAAASPGEADLAGRVRGVKSDLGVAGRLLELLPRLASIAAESPRETSIDDLRRLSGASLEEDANHSQGLLLRRLAAVDALRTLLATFQALARDGLAPRIHAEVTSANVSLRVETLGSFGTDPERLLHLPRDDERADALFLARAAVEADGGRLELTEHEGRVVALLSWPRPDPAREAEEVS